MNPFIISGYAGTEYFCDRKNELSKLTEAFRNGRNVTLFSLRRMGKSSLIKCLFENIKKEAFCVYVDIYSATNFQEMIELTANAVTDFFGTTFKDFLIKITNLIKSLNATLSYDELTGKPRIKIGIGDIQKQTNNLKQLINFLEKSKKRVLLVFDEFQSILNFTEKNTEAILRTEFQNCKKINFIFSGSNNRMLQSIFSQNAKPFYQSTQNLHLEEIEKNVYKKFIYEKFRKGRQRISDEQIDFIYESCRGHTYYIQMYCNRLFSKDFNGNNNLLKSTLEEILKENEAVYYNYKNLLTSLQWQFVKAVAKEKKVKEPFAGAFLSKYNLKSSSSIQRIIDSLLKREIIIFYKNNFMISDVFFSLWLQSNVI
jgi:archaellum component FlaC